MIKVGFIGYGSMGSMLIDAFIRSGKISPDEIIVSTRTKSKLAELKTRWNNIHITEDNNDIARYAKYIFICVKPLDVRNVLSEINGNIDSDTNIISIAGPVSIKLIEELTHAKVTKLTPSLTSEVFEGISLICHNNKVTKEEENYIESLLSGISRIKRIEEDDFELAAELTSCMPGFISAIFDEMVKSGKRHNSKLSKEDREEMVIQTLYGTAKLFIKKSMNFEEMIQRVATKGGITEEGVKVFRRRLPVIFDEMFEVTLNKRKDVKANVGL